VTIKKTNNVPRVGGVGEWRPSGDVGVAGKLAREGALRVTAPWRWRRDHQKQITFRELGGVGE
jgi:hypothetical protein